MHQRSHSELQGVSTRQGPSSQRTIQDGASRSSKPRGRGRPRLCPQRGAPLWAWLLLAALVVPGACSYLTEEQEEMLVDLHNHYRGQVSPSASAMLPLKWDPNLKLVAENYATQCIWNHNQALGDTGENLFVGTGPLDLREAMEKWFLEHLDYDFTNNSCPEDKLCGHYTQMVWADTHRVGCAFHVCNNMVGLDWERVNFIVCNYYPAGNYEDMRPYVEGDWCSACPENFQKCENNLCVSETVDDYDDEDVDDDMVSPPPSTDFPTSQPAVEEEGTVVPPPATSDPSIQPEQVEEEEEEEEKEEEVVPPPAATTPAITSILDAETPNTDPDTPPPGVPSNAEEPVEEGVKEEGVKEEEVKEEEVKDEVVKEEEVKDEVVEEEEVEERTEPTVKMEKKGERNIRVTMYKNNAGSVCSCSLLIVCLTVIQTLRL